MFKTLKCQHICQPDLFQGIQQRVLWMQAKREEYWDTQPHYGGDKGASPYC